MKTKDLKHWTITYYIDVVKELNGMPIKVRKVINESGYMGTQEDCQDYATRIANERGVQFVIEERQ